MIHRQQPRRTVDVEIGTPCGPHRPSPRSGRSKGGNTFILTGSHVLLTLSGANDIQGDTDTITDHSQGLEVKVGKDDGVISQWISRSHRFVGGVGGFKTARAVVAAFQSDGTGRTLLLLGASGQIDFVGVPVGTLIKTDSGATAPPQC